jgi:hypothetical protein
LYLDRFVLKGCTLTDAKADALEKENVSTHKNIKDVEG